MKLPPHGSAACTEEIERGLRLLNPMETLQDAGLEDEDVLTVVLMQHRMVATVGRDGMLSVWDITKPLPLLHKQIKLMPEGLLLASCISGDGNYLVTGSSAGVPKLWNAKQGEQIGSFQTNADNPATRHRGSVSCVDISPNGTLVCSGGNDFVVKVWDIDGHLVNVLIDENLETDSDFLPPRTHELQVTCVKFSPDSQRVATCSADCTVKIWDAREGVLLHSLGHMEAEAEFALHAVTSVCWSPSCNVLFSTTDRFVTRWDARTGAHMRTWAAHTGQVVSAACSIDGSILVTGSRDATAKIWDTENDICLRTLVFGENLQEKLQEKRQETSPRVEIVDIHPDGKHVTTGYSDGSTKVWEVASGKCTHTFGSNNFPIKMASIVSL